MVKKLLLIGFGGFAGSIARFFLSKLNLQFDWHSVPIGTLLVNISGCFLIGIFTGIADKSLLLTVEWRMFLMVGFCGGFTTFSTFAGENLMLFHNGQVFSVLIYTSLSVFLGFIAVYFGYILSNLL